MSVEKDCSTCGYYVSQMCTFKEPCQYYIGWIPRKSEVEKSPLKDSGTRVDFGTGAVRESPDGRGRFDLISTIGLRRLAIHYENGAKKYSDRNWEKGIPTHSCINSMFRHIIAYLDGDKSEDHLSAIAWNAFAIMHMEEKMPNNMQTIPTRLK